MLHGPSNSCLSIHIFIGFHLQVEIQWTPRGRRRSPVRYWYVQEQVWYNDASLNQVLKCYLHGDCVAVVRRDGWMPRANSLIGLPPPPNHHIHSCLSIKNYRLADIYLHIDTQ